MFLTRGGERWPVSKVQNTHPRFRRPKPYGPVALSCASHEALAERALFRANGGAPECLDQRWTRPRGPEKGESTGGCAEQALKTPRAGRRDFDEPAVMTFRIAFVP